MALPTVVGRYIAGPTTWKLDEFNGAPIFDVIFQLRQFFDTQQNEWIPVTGDLDITKRFFLKKNDGSWSEFVLDALVNSLGWDGGSLKGLVETDWSQKEVQLSIGYSERNGKNYIGVDFMNPRDYEGRNLTSDPATVQSLEAKYGSELRVRKSATGKSAAKTTPKPQTPAQKVMAPKTPDEAKRVTWAEFKAKTMAMGDDARKEAFRETVAQYGNGKDPAAMTINDWNVIANQIAEYGPYVKPEPAMAGGGGDDAPPITDDDLPF